MAKRKEQITIFRVRWREIKTGKMVFDKEVFSDANKAQVVLEKLKKKHGEDCESHRVLNLRVDPDDPFAGKTGAKKRPKKPLTKKQIAAHEKKMANSDAKAERDQKKQDDANARAEANAKSKKSKTSKAGAKAQAKKDKANAKEDAELQKAQDESDAAIDRANTNDEDDEGEEA